MKLEDIESMLEHRIKEVNMQFHSSSEIGLETLAKAVLALEKVKKMIKLGWDEK